jgi:cation-transporting ATPase I
LIGWRSPLVIATTLLSVAALVVVVEVPGLSQFFGCTPIGPLAWAIVAASAGVGTIAAVLAPMAIRSSTSGAAAV